MGPHSHGPGLEPCEIQIYDRSIGENEVHKALLELEEGFGRAQLVGAQELLGAIPSDEMTEEERQRRDARGVG